MPKVCVSYRIRDDIYATLTQYAAKERRSVSNLVELLTEWSLVELQKKGSAERLLRRRVPPPRNPDGDYRRKPANQRSPAKAHAENGV